MSRRCWRVFLGVALAVSWLLSLGACETASVVGGECVFGLSACGSRCVDVARDRRHCGRCGRDCEAEQQCRAGVCQAQGAPDFSGSRDAGAADAGTGRVTKD
ncbi:MAG: hypothetical protein RJA70_2676 [Pseudomonadota bacterium]|jgi:hypothetical protein